jgi:PEP-CTERM motif
VMDVKKLVLTTVAFLLLVTGAAFADSIDFSLTGNGTSSMWSWAGGSTNLSAITHSATVGNIGTSSITLQGNVLASLTSGLGAGGADPYTFGPSAAGSIVIDGCLPGQGSGCKTVTLFTGQFQTGEVAYSGSDSLDFVGTNVTGTINSGLASYFGFKSDNVAGSFVAVLGCATSTKGCATRWSGTVGSGNFYLAPAVPEPSSLFLMGSGVLALSLFLRARRR